MIISKAIYVIARTLSLFGLPGLRTVRSKIYALHFKATRLNVADRVFIGPAHKNDGAFIELGERIEIGSDVYIDYSGGLVVGDRVAISEGAKIFTHNHVVKRGYSNWHKNPIVFNYLRIGSDAWIGAGAIILPSVRVIGEGAVIAAGAVVSKDVPSLEVHGGNPASMIYVRDILSQESVVKTADQSGAAE